MRALLLAANKAVSDAAKHRRLVEVDLPERLRVAYNRSRMSLEDAGGITCPG